MVDLDAALFHRFLELPIADRIGHVPADAPKDTSRSKWLPLNSIIVLSRWIHFQRSYLRPPPCKACDRPNQSHQAVILCRSTSLARFIQSDRQTPFNINVVEQQESLAKSMTCIRTSARKLAQQRTPKKPQPVMSQIDVTYTSTLRVPSRSRPSM